MGGFGGPAEFSLAESGRELTGKLAGVWVKPVFELFVLQYSYVVKYG